MKTMPEIKEMIAQYQKTLEECNAVFEREGIWTRQSGCLLRWTLAVR